MFNRRFLCSLLSMTTVSLLAAELPSTVWAEECHEDEQSSSIAEFGNFSITDNYLTFDYNTKPSLDELQEMLPAELAVVLSDGTSTSLPVTWYCFGDDYQTSESRYFQFSPDFGEAYTISDTVNLYTDGPYVGVFIENDYDPLAAYGISLLSVTDEKYEQPIFDYLTNTLGYTAAAACGVMANAYAESTFRPNNLQDSANKSLGWSDQDYTDQVDSENYSADTFIHDGYGYGLFQWTYWSRKKELIDFRSSYVNPNGSSFTSIGDYKLQLAFLEHNLKTDTSISELAALMRSADNTGVDAFNVAYAFCNSYEKPADSNQKIIRGNLARNTYWKEYGNGTVGDTSKLFYGATTPTTPPADNSGSDTNSGAGTGSETGSGTVTLEGNNIYQVKASDYLSVRSNAGSSYSELGKLYPGTKISVAEVKNGWGRIIFNGKAGWVSLTYCAKINGLADIASSDGKYRYYKNMAVDTTFTGVAKNLSGSWYVKKGVSDNTTSGITTVGSDLWYLNKGKVDTSITGLYKTTEWIYFNKGHFDTSYTGLAKNSYGWWYVNKGRLDRTYTGMARNEYGWWYATKGKLDRTFTGMAKNSYGWWYLTKGKVDYSYTGMAKNYYGWWYITKGKLDRTYTGMGKNQYGWWYITDGHYDSTYTGMARNQYGWWYFNKGKLDRTFTGVAKNQYGYWYMKDGRVAFSYSGTITYNGVKYKVVEGKATKL